MSTFASSLDLRSPSTVAVCPFHDGLATLDAFLAQLDRKDRTLFDAALDLRSSAMAGKAGECVHHLFRVRALLDSRHYLAFYRVRCWARRTLRVQVRAHRGHDWLSYPFPLNGGRVDEVINNSLALLAENGEIPVAAHVRFTFADA